jgi:molecular chaperone DnaK
MELYPFPQRIKVLVRNKKITIQASGGLSDDEIDAMVREAEENAEADKDRKDLVEAKKSG